MENTVSGDRLSAGSQKRYPSPDSEIHSWVIPSGMVVSEWQMSFFPMRRVDFLPLLWICLIPDYLATLFVWYASIKAL